jgi:anaerobic selenocysteine-containing dehydrogenase
MIATRIKPLFNKLSNILHQKDGKYTSELLRSPGKHGLGQLPLKWKSDSSTNVVCGFCSTGCSLKVHLSDKQAVNITPSIQHPVNLGMACPKGWEALSPLKSDDRGTTPRLKGPDGKFKDMHWHDAMLLFTEKFKGIQEKHGKEAVAFLGTGQLATEELAFMGALAKFGMGFKHGDGNTRQCMATAVTAYKQSFGFDAPPYTYNDFEESDVIVLVGSNLCIAHPIMWERICRNKNKPEIIVIDPRKTETAMSASSHLMLKPKSDLVLFYGLARRLIKKGWIDETFIKEHCNDFEAFKNHVEKYDEYRVFEKCGIDKKQLHQLAKAIATGKKVSFWWTMGVNQSHEGTRVAQSIINLALMTGNIGKPGTGANSITGQCNAMGSRLFSNTTNLLGGHDFAKTEHRQKVADVLNIDASKIPEDKGYAYDQILEAIDRGEIKGLWVVGTNPSHSWLHQKKFKQIIDKLEFLVVQDMYENTVTAKEADLFLPAAGWGEKDGTFVNSERRFGLIKKVSKSPGLALADFLIFRLVADYWGLGKMFEKWESPEAVFHILKELSRDQPCDFSGIKNYEMIDKNSGIQWPFQENTSLTQSQRRLFEDGRFYHEDGKAKFMFEKPQPLPEDVDDIYNFILLTGRGTSAQWHTQTRTSKSKVLNKLCPENIYVEMHPRDAKQLEIEPLEKVLVKSKRGQLEVQVLLTRTVQRKQVFIPMHYVETNLLTFPAFDKYSRQPSFKHCAVKIEKLPL